jgi:hypothetical protein
MGAEMQQRFAVRRFGPGFSVGACPIVRADRVFGGERIVTPLPEFVLQKPPFDVVVFSYSDFNAQPIILRLPRSISFGNLETILIKALNLKYNPMKDLLLFFARDEATNGPSDQPLQEDRPLSPGLLGPGPYFGIFYLLEQDADERREYAREHTFTIRIASDGINVDRMFAFLARREDTTVQDIIKKAKITGGRNYRFFTEFGGIFVQAFTHENEIANLPAHSAFRIDAIPERQLGAQLVQVAWARSDRKGLAHTCGSPFFIEVTDEETVGQMRGKIARATHTKRRTIDDFRFVIGRPLMVLNKAAFLPDTAGIIDRVKELQAALDNIIIMLVHPEPPLKNLL